MQTITTSKYSVVLAVTIFITAIYVQEAAATDVCGTNIALENPATKRVCTTWTDPGAPVLGSDFTVDYECTDCEDAPRVRLVEGSETWQVWSEVISTNAPANIGVLEIEEGGDPENFKVKLVNGTTGGAGAEDVVSIALRGGTTSFWGSFAAGSKIAGDVTGTPVSISLSANSSGVGGDLNLTVLGDIAGAVDAGTIASGSTFEVDGKAQGLTVGPISSTYGDVAGDIDIETWESDVHPERLWIRNDFTGTMRIGNIVPLGGATLELLFGGTAGDDDFTGTVTLDSGIPAGVQVIVHGDLGSGGEVDLTNDAMAQWLEFQGGGAGTVSNVGAVSGCVVLGSVSTATFSGTATFDSVSSTGVINTINGAAISGTVNVTNSMAGDIDISGNFDSTGLISIGTCAGAITVTGKFGGDADIAGDVTSSGSITALNGTIGDITVGGDMAGAIIVDSDAGGDISVALEQSGTITIAHNLALRGRILVDGLISGAIDIGRATSRGSLIHSFDGLASGGSIEINSSEGSYDANGDIAFGAFASWPLPNVTFDGCIRIQNESGTGNDGDLEGDITVIGCHATDDDLAICVDGSVNGTITITQDECDNQVPGYACDGCP